MCILKYLRSKDGLPDPKGSLSNEIPERANSFANQQIRREMESGCTKKRYHIKGRPITIYKSCSFAQTGVQAS